MSRRSSSIDEKQLDNDIHSFKSQISKLTSELKKKEKQKRNLIQKKLRKTTREVKSRRSSHERKSRILTKASERLTMGTKTFNKKCKKHDYEKGAKRGKYICSKASDGYRYRPIGNPGDINYRRDDVTQAEGYSSFMHEIGGKVGPRFGHDDIERMNNEQIKRYEEDIHKKIEEEQMKPGGNIERIVARMSKGRIMRQADEDFEETVREELETMKVKALKRRAKEVGVEEGKLDDADAADDVKGTVIELIIDQMREENEHEHFEKSLQHIINFCTNSSKENISLFGLNNDKNVSRYINLK